jgi:DNA replication and repair protein RecF
MAWVQSLSIDDFRNFTQLRASLSPGANIIHGDNAQGKTNLLEAIFFCATGRSVRAGSDAELVRFGKAEAHVRLTYGKDDGFGTIDAVVQQKTHGETVRTKKYLSVDHVPIKKWNELLGKLLVVSFSPDDLRLVKAGPAERRAFMDTEISQLSPVYFNELKEYNRALKQRNHVLRDMQMHRAGTDELTVWDEQLVTYGRRIMRFRSAFIEHMAEITRLVHERITDGAERFTMVYKPHITDSDNYTDELLRNRQRDIKLGSTSAGVHKDDVIFDINGIPARAFGSQGQQRTAALSVKLAEIEIVRQSAGTAPLLLLDDVLSELDEHRQRFLLKQIGGIQTLLTCTGVEDVLRNTGHDGMKIMRMAGGEILEPQNP